MRILSLLLLLYFIYSYEENSIIKIPNKKGNFYNISTKYGLINYKFTHDCYELFKWPLPFVQINLEGIKDLSLFKLPKDGLNEQYILYGENNNSIRIQYLHREIDIFNPLLCELFYKTKYIDKMVYSIGYFEKNRPYKFFGGIPENITKNLKKLLLIIKLKISQKLK